MNYLNNKVQLIGFLGAKPQLKNLRAGSKMAKFRMATHTTYKNAAGERVKETQWHNLVAFGHLANSAEQYLDKGKAVAIEGKLLIRNYTDKQGVVREIPEIQLNGFTLLEGQRKVSDNLSQPLESQILIGE